MAWLSNENGEMYQVPDPVYNTYAEELAATQAATAGATTNYYDASANGGEGGQVYVYSNGSTVTTNNNGQPTSATLPTSQYQGTGGANSSEFRPIAGSPTSTNIGGFQVGIETPTLVGQNGQISYDQYGQPTTLRIQPELSTFDKVMRAGTLGLAVAPWALGASTGFEGASSTGLGTGAGAGVGAGATGAAGALEGSWGLSPELAAELGLGGSTSGLATDGVLGSQALEALGLNTAGAGLLGGSTAAAGGGLLSTVQSALKAVGIDTTGLTAAQVAGAASKLLGSNTPLGTKLSGLLGTAGNYALSNYQLGQLQNAYNQNVAGQQQATQLAQQQASFTPVGMTTAFGSSNFQYDPVTGKLTSAGYTPTSQVSGQVQNLFNLGSQALPTTTDTAQIQKDYIAQQQGLLAPGREQETARLQNRLYQRGTSGLATGGTQAGYAPNAQGLMATNPELAALYNARAQQDAQLAANAPVYAQNQLNQQIATGTGLFGAANTLEGYAQQPLSLSTALGTAGATAGAKAGYYGLLGNQSALATQLQGQQANIYGTGQALTTASQPLFQAAGNIIGNWLS